jgi:hypothetical protein
VPPDAACAFCVDDPVAEAKRRVIDTVRCLLQIGEEYKGAPIMLAEASIGEEMTGLREAMDDLCAAEKAARHDRGASPQAPAPCHHRDHGTIIEEAPWSDGPIPACDCGATATEVDARMRHFRCNDCDGPEFDGLRWKRIATRATPAGGNPGICDHCHEPMRQVPWPSGFPMGLVRSGASAWQCDRCRSGPVARIADLILPTMATAAPSPVECRHGDECLECMADAMDITDPPVDAPRLARAIRAMRGAPGPVEIRCRRDPGCYAPAVCDGLAPSATDRVASCVVHAHGLAEVRLLPWVQQALWRADPDPVAEVVAAERDALLRLFRLIETAQVHAVAGAPVIWRDQYDERDYRTAAGAVRNRDPALADALDAILARATPATTRVEGSARTPTVRATCNRCGKALGAAVLPDDRGVWVEPCDCGVRP